MNKTTVRPSVFIPTPESDSNLDISKSQNTPSDQSIPRDNISNKLMERLIEEIDRKSEALQKVGQDCLNLRKICSDQQLEIKKLTENLSESDLKTKRLINAFDIDIIPIEELRRRYALLAGKLETALERLNIANEKISKLDDLEIEKEKLQKENTALRQAHTAQQHLVLDLQESVQKAQKFKIVIQKQESVISKLEESLMKTAAKEGSLSPYHGTFAGFQARNSFSAINEQDNQKAKESQQNILPESQHQNILPESQPSASSPVKDFENEKKYALILEENQSLREKLTKLLANEEKHQDRELINQHHELLAENQRLKDELKASSLENQRRNFPQASKGDEPVETFKLIMRAEAAEIKVKALELEVFFG